MSLLRAKSSRDEILDKARAELDNNVIGNNRLVQCKSPTKPSFRTSSLSSTRRYGSIQQGRATFNEMPHQSLEDCVLFRNRCMGHSRCLGRAYELDFGLREAYMQQEWNRMVANICHLVWEEAKVMHWARAGVPFGECSFGSFDTINALSGKGLVKSC
ncbi:unnamed protein product [Linum trigynum]|uniref:Uncharacterized protein n=1 Tax=Linum trigynum TaxID=586398 RepID=A0AAV2FE67_9ROSI